MTKFTHQAPVVVVKKEKHPDAEKLSIVRLFEGTVQVVVNTDSWQDGELAVWIQPQSVVDCWKEPFTFLNKGDGEQWVRVKAMKLRGYMSNGCLAKIPEGYTVQEGADLAEVLDVRHWEPELESLTTGGQTVKGENLSKYDIDSGAKLHQSFMDGEDVAVFEKIHGTNFATKYNVDKQCFMVKTRNNWIEESPKSVHWKAFHSLNKETLEWLKNNPQYVLYGEATGDVKGFKYGLSNGRIQLFAFDIYDIEEDRFLDYDEQKKIYDKLNIVQPPFLGIHKHDYAELAKLAAGKSRVSGANHVMEGVVIRPMNERINHRGQRVIYKIISPEYNQ